MKSYQNINISSLSIIKVIFWLTFAYFTFLLRDFIVSLLVAVVIASSVDPLVKYLKKYKIPRSVTVPAVYLIVVGALLSAVIVLE